MLSVDSSDVEPVATSAPNQVDTQESDTIQGIPGDKSCIIS